MKSERTSIEANKAHFDWKDSEQREKGIYKKEYVKTINGMEVKIEEITKIGREFIVISFERNYHY